MSKVERGNEEKPLRYRLQAEFEQEDTDTWTDLLVRDFVTWANPWNKQQRPDGAQVSNLMYLGHLLCLDNNELDNLWAEFLLTKGDE